MFFPSQLFCVVVLLLKIFDKCKFKDLIAIVFILFYLSITYSESILRASVMFILFKLNKKLKVSNINIMILTLIIALLIDIHIIFKMIPTIFFYNTVLL